MRTSLSVLAAVFTLGLASAAAPPQATAAPRQGGTLEQACRDLAAHMNEMQNTLDSLGNCSQFAKGGYFLCMSWRASLQHDLFEMQRAWSDAHCDSIL